MSNYSQITNFTPKDSLPSGNPSKVIMGADFDGEFNAISTAIATKADSTTVSTLTSTVSSLSTTVDGKVTGAASSTDNTLPRFDGTTGKLIQGSGVVVDDSNNVGIGITPDATGRLSISGAASGAWPTTASGLTLNGAATGTSTITSYLDTSSVTIGAGVTQKTGITINGQTSASGSSIEMRTGNATRATLDASGNLGVGTSANPLNHQIVNYKAGVNPVYFQVANGATGMGASNGLRVGVNAAGNAEILSGASGYVTLDSSGKLGIGRTPSYALDVANVGAGNYLKMGDGTHDIGAYISGGRGYFGTLTSSSFALMTGGTERVLIGTSGNLTLNAGTFGYGTGAGGTVTQATSKSTSVTLNKPSGTITTHSSSLGANTSVYFLFSNSFITAKDTLVLSVYGGGAAQDKYNITAGTFSGGAYISIRNMTGSALGEPIDIYYTVITGSTT